MADTATDDRLSLPDLTLRPQTQLSSFAGSLYGEASLPSMDEGYQGRTEHLMGERERASAAHAKATEDVLAEGERQYADITAESARGGADRKKAKPGDLALPEAPSGQARTFLDAGKGASPLSQMFMLMLGVGQMGMQIGGLRGSSLAATAAIKGMAEGWAAGDNDRIRHEHAAWEQASKKLIREHEAAVEKYQNLVEDQKLTWEQKRAAGTLLLKNLEWGAAQKALDVGDIDAALKEVNSGWARHQATQEKMREFDANIAERKRHNQEQEAIQRENRAERAREADQRLGLAITKYKAAQADQGGQNFTPEALEMYAQVVANGGQQPALGWGKASTEARIKIANRAAEIRKQRGDTAGSLLIDQMAQKANQTELNRLQSQRGPVLAFSKAAEGHLRDAERLSETVDREQYPAFNRWLLSGELKWAGDPGVASFAAATREAINAIARVTTSATGGGVSTDTARRQIEELLSTSLNPEQFRAVANTLRQQMSNRVSGYEQQIDLVRESIGSSGAPQKEGSNIQRIRRKGTTGPVYEGPRGRVPDGFELAQ